MGRMIGIVLVGRLNGVPHIRWGAALLLACALGIVCAMVAAATYFALCGGFSPLAAAVGFAGPFITVGAGIQTALRLPVEQLTALDPPAA